MWRVSVHARPRWCWRTCNSRAAGRLIRDLCVRLVKTSTLEVVLPVSGVGVSVCGIQVCKSLLRQEAAALWSALSADHTHTHTHTHTHSLLSGGMLELLLKKVFHLFWFYFTTVIWQLNLIIYYQIRSLTSKRMTSLYHFYRFNHF